jgi:hypothetical protein
MMEAARTPETSVDNYFTRQYNPEDKSELIFLFESPQAVDAVIFIGVDSSGSVSQRSLSKSCLGYRFPFHLNLYLQFYI